MKFCLKFLFLFSLILPNAFAQENISDVDFNTFTQLKSYGKVPMDFINLKESFEYSKNSKGKSKKLEKRFLDYSKIQISYMLESGNVTFGNAVSKYCNQVLNSLIINDTYRKKVRVYVIKSNLPNAFASDLGLIFITTGLISKLDNEAQLAFVLSHELSHFIKSHSVENYKEIFKVDKEEKDLDNKLKILSNYSKKNELEADSLGASIYLKSKYAPNEIIKALDVLRTSHLHFSNRKFDNNYFNQGNFYIPKKRLEVNKVDIKDSYPKENFDPYSTHPDIDKRKNEIINTYKNILKDGLKFQILNQEQFIKIRNICRFQNVYENLTNKNYEEAFYDIYNLEKDLKIDSKSLNLSLCKSLIGISVYSDKSKFFKEKYHDELYKVSLILESFNKEEIYTLAAKTCFEEYKKDTTNKDIKAYTLLAFHNLSQNTGLKPEHYKISSFKDSVLGSPNKYGVKDSLQLTKIDKTTPFNIDIKESTSNEDSTYKNTTAYKEDQFYLHNVYTKQDQIIFENLYNSSKIDDFKPYRLLNKSDSYIVLSPLFFQVKEKNAKLVSEIEDHNEFEKIIVDNLKELNVKYISLNNFDLDSSNVLEYNENSLLKNYVIEVFSHSNDNHSSVFNSNSDAIQKIKSKYNSSYVILPISISVKVKENVLRAIVSAITLVGVPLAIWDLSTPDYVSLVKYVVIDLDRSRKVYDEEELFKKKPSNGVIRQRTYFLTQEILKNVKNE